MCQDFVPLDRIPLLTKAALVFLLLGTLAPAFAAPAQTSSGTSKSSGRSGYAPLPPSYAKSSAASSSGGSTTSRTKSGGSGGRTLTQRVDHLDRNDRRQDQRISSLERDVGSLSGQRPGSSSSPQKSSAPQGTRYQVRKGDTLWRIADKFNTSINALRTANRLTGDVVAAGQVLMIPNDSSEPVPTSGNPVIHVVKAGDSFSKIAQNYRVTQDELARANPTAYPDRLLIGERLLIPAAGGKFTAAKTESGPSAPRSTSSGGDTHTVRAGESLGVIAKKYGIATASLASANKLADPNHLEVGRKLVIPSGPSQPRLTPAPAVASAPSSSSSSEPPARLVTHKLNSAPATDARPEDDTPAYPASSTMVETAAKGSHQAPPPKTTPRRGVVAYRLEKGDDLTTVANMFSTTPTKIRELNRLSPTQELKEGDEVVVPSLGAVSLD